MLLASDGMSVAAIPGPPANTVAPDQEDAGRAVDEGERVLVDVHHVPARAVVGAREVGARRTGARRRCR